MYVRRGGSNDNRSTQTHSLEQHTQPSRRNKSTSSSSRRSYFTLYDYLCPSLPHPPLVQTSFSSNRGRTIRTGLLLISAHAPRSSKPSYDMYHSILVPPCHSCPCPPLLFLHHTHANHDLHSPPLPFFASVATDPLLTPPPVIRTGEYLHLNDTYHSPLPPRPPLHLFALRPALAIANFIGSPLRGAAACGDRHQHYASELNIAIHSLLFYYLRP